MPDVDAILRNRSFWMYYANPSETPLKADVLCHFDKTTINGNQYDEAVISLPCGSPFSLDVTIRPYFSSVNLGLRNTQTNDVQEMGWWDDIRCHPFALRWTELLRLYSFWSHHEDFGMNPNAAFLLLVIFVGHGIHEQDSFSNRKDVIRDHYKRLELFSDSELTMLTDKTFVLPTEDDYHWKRDEELGWLFGGDYPCYSIRNREHSDGSEGHFPFSEWSSIVDQFSPE